METVLSLFIGIGLSAATGFRVFVPFLIMSIAALSGHLDLAPGFEWIGSYPALIVFATATVIEVAAYLIPWLDNLLDTIATPVAVVAGVIATAAIVTGMSPLLKWALAVIMGGGAATVVQASTVTVRAGSTATTGGLANPVVAIGEFFSSVVTTLLAIVVPILTVILLGTGIYLITRQVRRISAARAARTSVQVGADGT
jgi:hypothetical protein